MKFSYNVNAITQTTAPLRVKRAATVMCVRRRTDRGPEVLSREELGVDSDTALQGDGNQDGRIMALFRGKRQATFSSGWEILMGQRECVNWLRSTKDKKVAMRYPGEWNFFGGSVEPEEELVEAARREIQEELGIMLPPECCGCRLRLFSVKQTRPIRNVSNLMYNFVAIADEENPWLRDLDLEHVNGWLEDRRRLHRTLLDSGEYWDLPAADKERASPETRAARWLGLGEAVRHAFSSMNDTVTPIDAFQEGSLRELGIRRRDPMYITMLSCLDLEHFKDEASIIAHCETLGTAEEQTRKVQWLRDGLTPEQVQEVFSRRKQADRNTTLFQNSARAPAAKL